MAKPKTYIITRAEFNNLKLLSCHGSVLIKIENKNTERVSDSGIILIGDTDFNPADHADRTGIIEWVPEYLNKRSLDWLSENEVKVGDKVWFDYLMGMNCIRFLVDGQEYKYMRYSDLYAVKRGDKMIMLNGYCLFSPVKEEIKSSLYIANDSVMDARYGVCVHEAKPINDYFSEAWIDDPVIKVGTKAIFGLPPVMLEYGLHQEFEDGANLRISQRRFILGYEDSGEVKPVDGCVTILPDDNIKKFGEIIVPTMAVRKNRYGVVLSSKGVKSVNSGDRVMFYPESATYVKQDKKDVCVLRASGVQFKM